MLVYIVGPPAVGKMTVSHHTAVRTGLKLLHNHHTIELVLPLFEFGTPSFNRLVREFRLRILEEVAASELTGTRRLHDAAGKAQPSECALPKDSLPK